VVDPEAAESAYLYPPSSRQRAHHLVQDRADGQFDVFGGELGLAGGQVLDEFCARHIGWW
jgi:hypothetical protein